MGSIIGGAYRTVASAAGSVTSAAGEAVQTAASRIIDPFASIERTVRGATGGNDPAALRDTAVTAVRAALTGDQNQARMPGSAPLRPSLRHKAFPSIRPAARFSNMSSNTDRPRTRSGGKPPTQPRSRPKRCRQAPSSVPSL